jgi:signal transduction histidine kinase
VDDYADRFDIDVERNIDDTVDPPTEVQGELLRVCREALNNVRKHADASKVNVELRQAGSALRLIVRDNGKGFDPAALNGRGFGMESMRQRASKIAGTLEVRSQPMGGTTVDLELPLAAETANI